MLDPPLSRPTLGPYWRAATVRTTGSPTGFGLSRLPIGVEAMRGRGDSGLTPRERQVAVLVRDGLTDREIADRMAISRRTAEWYVEQILNKLGASSRAQVAAWAATEIGLGLSQTAADGRSHNLPTQLSAFIGRESETSELLKLLATNRLVTVTGAAGVGKTRFVLQVASQSVRQYRDGVWLVDLSAISDGSSVLTALAEALQVHEWPRQPLVRTLTEHLRHRTVLLVVDNCEQVAAECARLVETILRTCAQTTILATSREPLHVEGELVYRLPTLPTPQPGAMVDVDGAARYGAISLFADRARLANPDFRLDATNLATVAELCRGLDGLPLAIELAAARAGALSPAQMLERLRDRFRLLAVEGRTGPARHRTLSAALDWSHELLTEPERVLFRRLSVFAGSFDLPAAEQVCASEDLQSRDIIFLLGNLVDKSLVLRDAADRATERFRLLESVRQHSSQYLSESADSLSFGERHSQHFLSLAEIAFPKLRGPEQGDWHIQLNLEIDNLRAALAWSEEHDSTACVRLAYALQPYWVLHGLAQEGNSWVERALSVYPDRDALRARALAEGGWLAVWSDDKAAATARWHECIDIYRDLEDRDGIGQSLTQLGQLAFFAGDLENARRYYDESRSVLEQGRNRRELGVTLMCLGELAGRDDDFEKARAWLESSLAIFIDIGDSRMQSYALTHFGHSALKSGRFEEARRHFVESLRTAASVGFKYGVSSALLSIAGLAAVQNDPIRAIRLVGASEWVSDLDSRTLEWTEHPESRTDVAPRILTPGPFIGRDWLRKAQAEIGLDMAEECFAEGRAMSRERAIEYALDTE